MKEKYTQQDVQRLVEAAEECCSSWREDRQIHPQSTRHGVLEHALAPFRPDPEEELIKAMLEAFGNSYYGNIKNVEIGLRRALQVIKEKGYFNDQR